MESPSRILPKHRALPHATFRIFKKRQQAGAFSAEGSGIGVDRTKVEGWKVGCLNEGGEDVNKLDEMGGAETGVGGSGHLQDERGVRGHLARSHRLGPPRSWCACTTRRAPLAASRGRPTGPLGWTPPGPAPPGPPPLARSHGRCGRWWRSRLV